MTLPSGYRFAATYAGIRKTASDDLALMVSDRRAATAAVFTTNLVKAAPLVVSARHLAKSRGWCRAIVANAGNANCATGNGIEVARATAREAARVLGVPEQEVLLASTGVIGVPLEERRLLEPLRGLAAGLSSHHFEAAARAIMTTDTRSKAAFVEVPLRSGTVRIAGMTKGSGMIHPRMATMLAFVFTDAAASPAQLKRLLSRTVKASFNRISVDGDTSTNDTVYLLANGAAGCALQRRDLPGFEKALSGVMEDLAIQIVRDGEGAKKLLNIVVSGAANDAAAERIARAIANSPLVKTALAGADPNWGRILSSAGVSGATFDPARVDIEMNGVVVCRGGIGADYSEPEVQHSLRAPESTVRFTIRGRGAGTARFWTCDLTEDYIRINASYRT